MIEVYMRCCSCGHQQKFSGSVKQAKCPKCGEEKADVSIWSKPDWFLSDDEQRLRDSIIRQNQGVRNIAPGSPLYDRVLGTSLTYIVVALLVGWSIGVLCVLGTMAVQS